MCVEPHVGGWARRGLLALLLLAPGGAFAQAGAAGAAGSTTTATAARAPDLPALPEPDALEAGALGRGPGPRVYDDARALDLPENSQAQAVPTERDLAARIEARARALRSGDLERADLELSLIEELRLALAARNVVVVSAQLIQEAKVAMELGRLDVALERAAAAARLSPDLEAAHWMRARLMWRKDKAQVPRIAAALKDLAAARVRAFRNQVSFVTQLATIGGLAVIATIALFVLLQLVRYLHYPAHDLARRVPDFVGAGEVAILLLVLVLLPFGLDLGLAPTLAVGLAVVLGYQQVAERAASLAVLALLAAGPLVLHAAAPLVSFHGSLVDAMAEATSEAFAEDAERRLVDEASGRGDYASAMVLAHRMRQRGDMEEAEAAYRRALGADPSKASANNNLGVVLLAQGRFDEAEQAFQNAIGRGGGAEPTLNLALLAAERGRFDESSRRMEQARALDAGLVSRQTSMGGSLANKAAVAPLDEGLLWGQLFAANRAEASRIVGQLWRPLSGRLPPWGASLAVVAAGLLGLLAVRREGGLSTPCPKCSLPAPRTAQGQLCEQCRAVFLSSTPVDTRLKAKKERSVRRHQRQRRWVERALALFAGAGHVFAGRPAMGLLLLLPFTVIGIGIFWGELAAVHPWFVYVDAAAREAKIALSAVLMVALSAVSLKSIWER